MKIYLSQVSETVTALCAFTGVVIAGMGLKTWRKQLQGTTEYELAKRLLLQTYKVRDAVQYVRQPFLLASEATSKDKNVPWEVSAYENRWQNLRSALVDFDAVTLECEVLWGTDVVSMKNTLSKLVRRLNNAVSMFMQSKVDKAFEPDFTKELRDILYGRGEDDAYNKELLSVIKKFENFVKPHLKK